MAGARDGGVGVANPSSQPEMYEAASALSDAGLLSRYFAPVITTPSHERRAERLLPSPLRRAALRELRRRRLPEGVPPAHAVRIATGADLRRVLASRLNRPQSVRTRLAHRQRELFDKGVAARLDPSDRAFVGVAGTAARSVQRAQQLGMTTILDSALTHLGWLRDLMREEALLTPEYATTLQVHDFPDRLVEAEDAQLRACDHLLTLSTHARQTLIDRGIPDSKISTTPLGVDLDLFRPAGSADGGSGAGGDRFRVLFVGQITQRKGISYLLEAFRKLALPRSDLVFVGEVVGSPEPWLGQRGVRHVPVQARADLRSHYIEADVYVLPSLAEGFGLTAIEAMACGLPVILSEHTVGRDLVTDGEDGYIVPIRDADAIAVRLEQLARDPDLRARMGAAARRRAEDFPWTRYRTQLVDAVRAQLPALW